MPFSDVPETSLIELLRGQGYFCSWRLSSFN